MKNTLPGLLMSAAVLGAALFAFSPRPLPAFPASTIAANHLQINGLAQAGSRTVAVGERGVILLSDDAGKSWRRAAVTPDEASTLTQVFFVSPSIGVAVGHDGWILRTVDGGEHWQETHFDHRHSDPLLAIWGQANGPLFVIGSFGQLFVSHDEGATWTAGKTPTGDRHLNAIAGDGKGRIVIAGETGTLLVSNDDGTTWDKRPSPYAGSLFGVLPLADGTWLAYGMRGNVVRSTDGGQTWAHIDSGVGVSYFGATQLPGGRLVLVGQGGAIVTSDDEGEHYAVRKAGGVQSLAAVLDEGQSRVLVAGEAGVTRWTVPAQTVPAPRDLANAAKLAGSNAPSGTAPDAPSNAPSNTPPHAPS
ncbi:WD40/YVTN/BNR-like repeat-containing protein [Paraburkholderia pallida]|uniref:Sialidase n=1 Tax=Paraburkholderia pallida TaxID=2547399 RepID=A0A4V1B0I0_9BURK|nr:YCF48-related protein [Paraburkholderia pallida]QBR02843.1 sialidase [Paraburkholderia pallida]